MTVRTKPRKSIARGSRRGWRARNPAGVAAPLSTGAERGGGAGPDLVGSRHRRDVGVPQDRALYSCDCGLVFHAPVSTSVGCPECGSTQAW